MRGSDWLRFLERIADRADGIALRYFRSSALHVEQKRDLSPVTEADRAIEDAARELVDKEASELGVHGEEHGETAGRSGARLWIDPIDGTRNFVRGIPIFASLLAIEEDGEIVAGVVSAPALHERWSAARGHGAWRGTTRIRVSAVATIAEANVFHGDITPREGGPLPAGFHTLARHAARTRGFGDFYQHVLVAEGAGDVAIDPVVRPWDIAPLVVIVEEAGGRVTSLAGERTIHGGSLVTTNGLVHGEVLGHLTTGV
jgi:histidinol-phosphatase